MSKGFKKILAGLVIAVIAAMLGSAMGLIDAFSVPNQKLTHSLYEGREIGDDIIIVAVDDVSISSTESGGIGAPGLWSPDTYSQALDYINAGNPHSVMIDRSFSDTKKSLPYSDIASLAQHNLLENDEFDPESFSLNVLDYLKIPSPLDANLIQSFNETNNLFLIKTSVGKSEFNGDSIVMSQLENPASLYSENATTGFVGVEATDNRTVYRLPYQISYQGEIEKHMDVQIAERFLERSIENVPTEDGYWNINYADGAFSFPMYSFLDVYRGRVPAEAFEDKIVMIGPTALLLQDLFFTPIDEDNPMPGVEIHANAIQTLLDEAYLQYEGNGAFMMSVIVIALLSVFAFLYLPITAATGVLVAEIVAFPLYAQWRFDGGMIINLIWPVFTMVVAYVLVLAYRNMTEFREKRKLRNAFSHYVSPDLVKQISDSGADLALGGERRYMTTLFLDIENFTSLSEQLEPHDVVSIINKYFDAFAKEIMAHGGTVDKFEGDAIMALFGAPLKSEDHALKACETAMAIRSKVGELNAATGQNLNVRIGIASGDCIVGNMGSESRFDYTAMGDTVNTASRLEGGNKFYGTRILVNSGTMEGAQEKIFFRRIDRVRLKGKAEAIDIYEVMGGLESVSEAGKAIVNEWHSALDYYRNQDWVSVESKMRAILEKMPEDGPALTYLKRIEQLRNNPPEGWDGVWTFTSK